MAKKKVVTKKKITAKKKAVTKKKVAKKPAVKSLDLSKLISPLDDRLIIQLEKTEKVTAGGLYIPDTAELAGNMRGVVVAVGRGHRNKFGKIQPMEVKVGDRIMIADHSGDQIEILGHHVKIVREGDVLGILE